MISKNTPTIRKYYDNTYLGTHKARVLNVQKEGNEVLVICDETIFHPQGGGQPSDLGYFTAQNRQWNVVKLSESGGIIKHYVTVPDDIDPTSLIQTDVVMHIDLANRTYLAKIHSAGHLLEDAITQLNLPIQAYKGFHDPQGPSVFFTFKDGGNLQTIQNAIDIITSKVNALIEQSLPMTITYQTDGTRLVQFQGLNSLRCGGTHVCNTNEIGSISIRKIQNEKNGNEKVVKIGYNVT